MYYEYDLRYTPDNSDGLAGRRYSAGTTNSLETVQEFLGEYEEAGLHPYIMRREVGEWEAYVVDAP